MSKRHPPSSEDVARRAIILKHVAIYGAMAPPRELLQELLEAWSEEDRTKFVAQAEQIRERFWEPILRSSLTKHLTPSERELSQTTMYTMTHQQHVNATWRVESAQVLMWALGMIDDLPPLHVKADHELLKRIPVQDTGLFIREARLRPREQIHALRGTAEFWHWRSRTRRLIEEGRPFATVPALAAAGITTFDDVVRMSAKLALEKGTLQEIVDEDFVVDGVAYRELSHEAWQEVRSVTAERHLAFNWVCGYAPGNRWDETPTDT